MRTTVVPSFRSRSMSLSARLPRRRNSTRRTPQLRSRKRLAEVVEAVVAAVDTVVAVEVPPVVVVAAV